MNCPDCHASHATLVRCEVCDAVRCYTCAVPADPLDEDLCTSAIEVWIVANPKKKPGNREPSLVKTHTSPNGHQWTPVETSQ